MTKCHRLGGLKNRYSYLTALEAGKSKIKVSADCFWRVLSSWLGDGHSLTMCSREVGIDRQRQKGTENSVVSSNNTNPIRLGPHPYDFTLNYLLKFLFPDTVTLEVRVSTYKWGAGGVDTIQSIPSATSQGSVHSLLFLSPTVIWTPQFMSCWPQISL